MQQVTSKVSKYNLLQDPVELIKPKSLKFSLFADETNLSLKITLVPKRGTNYRSLANYLGLTEVNRSDVAKERYYS